MTEPDVQAAVQATKDYIECAGVDADFSVEIGSRARLHARSALALIERALGERAEQNLLRDAAEDAIVAYARVYAERDALLRENAVHRASFDAIGNLLGRENWSGGVGGWSISDVERMMAGLRADKEKLHAFWLDLWEIFSDGEGGDIDQEAFLAACESAGLVVQVAYDPDTHGELAWGDSEPGEMIYMPATPTRRGAA